LSKLIVIRVLRAHYERYKFAVLVFSGLKIEYPGMKISLYLVRLIVLQSITTIAVGLCLCLANLFNLSNVTQHAGAKTGLMVS
jgi:hypothetical protein